MARYQCGSAGTVFGQDGDLRPCTCRACELARADGLLSSEGWTKTRGNSSGDIPGETMAQTIRREAVGLRAVIKTLGNGPTVEW